MYLNQRPGGGSKHGSFKKKKKKDQINELWVTDLRARTSYKTQALKLLLTWIYCNCVQGCQRKKYFILFLVVYANNIIVCLQWHWKKIYVAH